jgi:hypothetical protein
MFCFVLFFFFCFCFFVAGSHPAWNYDFDTPYVWMNVDVDGNDGLFFGGRLFDDDTLVHEVGHYLGMKHTFDTELGCVVNDMVDDTTLGNNRQAGCNAGGKDACDNENEMMDYSNLMSYGYCRVGVPITNGQFRLMRKCQRWVFRLQFRNRLRSRLFPREAHGSKDSETTTNLARFHSVCRFSNVAADPPYLSPSISLSSVESPNAPAASAFATSS